MRQETGCYLFSFGAWVSSEINGKAVARAKSQLYIFDISVFNVLHVLYDPSFCSLLLAFSFKALIQLLMCEAREHYALFVSKHHFCILTITGKCMYGNSNIN